MKDPGAELLTLQTLDKSLSPLIHNCPYDSAASVQMHHAIVHVAGLCLLYVFVNNSICMFVSVTLHRVLNQGFASL